MVYGIFLGTLFGILLGVGLGGLASIFSGLGERFWRATALVVIAAIVAAAAWWWLHASGNAAKLDLRRGVALGLLAAAIVVAAANRNRLWGARGERGARRPRRPRALASSSSLLGLVAIAVTAGGYIAYRDGHGPIAMTVAAIGGIGFAILTFLEIRRGQRVIDSVRARITDARHWPLPEPPSEEGSNPWEDDRVTGRWGQAKVWVALVIDGAVARVELERWPVDLGVHGGRADTDSPATGDEAFDRCVVLEGDEATWRPVLSADVRERLVRLVGEGGGVIAAGERILECAVSESHVGWLPRLLDDMAALAAALPEASEPRARVFEITAAEPLAGVRRGNYAWLEGQGWNTPAVLRAAARDPDPDIAAWARQRLPPEGGIYR